MQGLMNKTFDSRFDNVFQKLINKKYRIDLSMYGFHEYSLIDEQVFVISNIIKKISDLVILIPNIEIDSYIVLLERIISDSETLSNLYDMMDNCLIDMLIEEYKTKDRIVSYVIDRYIDNGYCYHGFNSSFENDILSNGINGDNEISNRLKYINGILEKYGIINAMTYNWSYKDNNSVFTTDNFGAAYYYSLLSPVLLSRFVSNGLYTYKDGYDNSAFYVRNYNGVVDNTIKILHEYNVSDDDKNIIMNVIKELISKLFDDGDNLSIALIDKKSINRNNPANTCGLNINDSVRLLLKPQYELDRHENTVFDKDMIKIIKLKNYTKLLKNFG